MQRSTMTLTSAVVLGGLTAIAVVVSACGGQDANGQATSPSAYPQQQGGYYPQQQQGYPQQYPQQQQAYPQQQPYPQQQQPYPQQQPTAYPTAPAPTAAPTATAAGTMATPGPLAMACTSDAACGLHKCNTQYSKCAFPCAGAVDCAAGNQCTMGVCMPGMGGH